MAFTDGSAQQVRGLAWGILCGYLRAPFAAHVRVQQWQSVSRWGLSGVLHALLQRRPGGRLVVVLDAQYVYKAIMEWSPKWRCQQWPTSDGEVGHRDLWERILWERERVGDNLLIRWVPSFLGVQGNMGADRMVELRRESHPNNDSYFVARDEHFSPLLCSLLFFS